MYSRISHNIVEEQFNEPKKPSIQRLNNSFTGSAYNKLPEYVINENTLNFRMDARSLWAKYTWGLLNYGISLNGMLPNTELVESKIIKNAVAIGDFLTPYYGISAGEKVSKLLAGIGQVGIDVVKAVKENEKLDTLLSMWETLIDEISELFNELNPTNWPETLIRDYFSKLVKHWTEQIIARDRNDETSDELAVEQLYKLVVIGIVNSVPTHKISSLSDTFSRGIIAQFPDLFLD